MPAGRPTDYKPEYCERIRIGALNQVSDERLALALGIDMITLAKWAWDNEDFFNAITPTEEEIKEHKDKKYKSRAKIREYRNKRRKENPSLRIEDSTRSRMWAAVKGNGNEGKLFSRLPYSKEELIEHLKLKLTDGMSLENYGKWHIDHIKPCHLFDLTHEEEFLECWNLNNLQPLWAHDNVSKGSKYDPEG